MAPIVDGIEQTYGDKIAVKRVNADVGEGPTIMRSYRIQGHPTTLVFDNEGQEVQRFFGPQSSETVQEVLEKIIAGEP